MSYDCQGLRLSYKKLKKNSDLATNQSHDHLCINSMHHHTSYTTFYYRLINLNYLILQQKYAAEK